MAFQNPLFDHGATMLFDYVNSLNTTFADALDKNRALMTKSMDLLRDEGFALADRRLDRNRDTIERWHECGEMAEMLSLQQEWLNQFAHDYLDGTLRASALMQKAMVERMATANGHAQPAEPAVQPKKAPEEPARKAA